MDTNNLMDTRPYIVLGMEAFERKIICLPSMDGAFSALLLQRNPLTPVDKFLAIEAWVTGWKLGVFRRQG